MIHNRPNNAKTTPWFIPYISRRGAVYRHIKFVEGGVDRGMKDKEEREMKEPLSAFRNLLMGAPHHPQTPALTPSLHHHNMKG